MLLIFIFGFIFHTYIEDVIADEQNPINLQ